MVDEKKSKVGKQKRAQGAAFEVRVRKDLEEKGWTVDKWTNNVEFEKCIKNFSICPGKSEHTTLSMNGKETNSHIETAYTIEGKLIRAKNKWVGPGRPMMIGAGFPDFIAFRPMSFSTCYARVGDISTENYEVIGVESKMEGELKREEKEKCKWLLDNKIFSKILIAEKTKVKNRVVIVYHDFKEKYWRFYK